LCNSFQVRETTKAFFPVRETTRLTKRENTTIHKYLNRLLINPNPNLQLNDLFNSNEMELFLPNSIKFWKLQKFAEVTHFNEQSE